MFVNFNTTNLDDEYINNLDMVSTSEIVEDVDRGVKRYLDAAREIKKIIEPNKKEISDEEFVTILKKICSVSLDEDDYLEIMSSAHNKKFFDYSSICSLMKTDAKEYAKHGESLSWENTDCLIELDVAYTEDANINEDNNQYYSNRDIQQLIDESKIVIVGIRRVPIPNYIDKNKTEPYHNYKIVDEEAILSENSLYFPHVLKYIRNNVSLEKIKEGRETMLSDLDYELSHTIYRKNIPKGYPAQIEASIACQKRLEEKGYVKELKLMIDEK